MLRSDLLKNLKNLRMIIPKITEWIESDKIVLCDIYNSRQLIDTLKIDKIVINDCLEIIEESKNKSYCIDLNSIKSISEVNNVCCIEFDKYNMFITNAA